MDSKQNSLANKFHYLILQTLEWTSKLVDQLYPIITSESTRPKDILKNLEKLEFKFVPELDKALSAMNNQLKSLESLKEKSMS